MGRCPFCMANTMQGQTICYSCGRVISGAGGMQQRVRGSGAGPGSTTGSSRGSGRIGYGDVKRRGRRRKRKSGMSKLVMMGAIVAVFMFTPAQEVLLAQWQKLEGQLGTAFAPYHEYPVNADYEVERSITLFNYGTSEGSFRYTMPIPIERTTRGVRPTTFTISGSATTAAELQHVDSMIINGAISVPTDGTIVTSDNAITVPGSATVVFYPGEGTGTEQCVFGPCVRWQGTIPPNGQVDLRVRYSVEGQSYTWWSDSTVDNAVPGKTEGFGIRASNSGTLADIQQREGGAYWNNYGRHAEWYDRSSGGTGDYAIDGTHPLVITAANEVRASLSAEDQDNALLLARGAFDYVRANVEYGRGLPLPRNGPTCLQNGLGDCDEQSNAWMSIMRVWQIPSWYEFGALTSGDYAVWEPHGWANVMVPYSAEWCSENGIELSTCYVEASTDVTNNKFMLHTPTAFTEYIEKPDPSGDTINGFYRALSISASQWDWQEHWETVGTPTVTGGTYKVHLLDQAPSAASFGL